MSHISVKIPIQSPIHYSIFIGANLYDFFSWLPKNEFTQIVIITDNTVKKRYGLHLQMALNKSGKQSLLLSFPAGEKYKNNKTKQTLENKMLRQHCDRSTLLIALGGGVVGDLTGFIAATYMRGVPYIQIPTTLLAMVDSSVGGKTAINSIHGKNLIGLIYQPFCVVADISLLKSLSKKQRINGLIEAIKMFLTHDAASFHYLESYSCLIIKGDEALLKDIVSRAVKIKAGIVERDEKECGERNVLNFGHTIGHALEKLSHYTLLHGYAVAYGILVEANISYTLGLLPSKHLIKIEKLFSQLGIHGKDLKKYNLPMIIQATKNDKKTHAGKVHYILLKAIGSTYVAKGHYVHSATDRIVRRAFKSTIEE